MGDELETCDVEKKEEVTENEDESIVTKPVVDQGVLTPTVKPSTLKSTIKRTI